MNHTRCAPSGHSLRITAVLLLCAAAWPPAVAQPAEPDAPAPQADMPAPQADMMTDSRQPPEELIRRIIGQRALRELLSHQIAIAKMQKELHRLQSPSEAAAEPAAKRESRPQASDRPVFALPADAPAEPALPSLVGTWKRSGEQIAAVSGGAAQIVRHLRVGDALPGMRQRLIVSRIDASGVWITHPETGDETLLPR